jgi:alpha-L-fucosidase
MKRTSCLTTPKGLIMLLLGLFLILGVSTKAQPYQPNWESLNSRPIPQWFIDAKFGIFIHWGLYSVPAWAPANEDIGVYAKYAEWYWWRIMNTNDKAGLLFREYHNNRYGENFLYQDFAPQFKGEHFDPAQWAELFQQAGAKYVVLTSKHHEGFALWPSEQSWNWNSVDIGPHRDICGDLGQAVKDAGLHMGFYYSLYEWFNPLYRNNIEKYVDDHMLPQMKDLITRYQPDLLWPDGEWDHLSGTWKSTEFLTWLYNESPVKAKVVVNDRWGKETRGKHGGYYTTEYDMVHVENGELSKEHPWEECRGIGTSFGYNRMETPGNYMTSEALIHLLVEKVASGGNLLLNVGPTADGRIPEIQQQKLLDIGHWLQVNGDAIYGTRTWDKTAIQADNQNLHFTVKGNDLFVICTRWPNKPIVVSGLNKPGKISLLGSNVIVSSKVSGGKISITPPAINPGNNLCKYAWVFKIEGAVN